MKSPLILVSSGRFLGELSIQRRQSELYGACLSAAGGCGVLYTLGHPETLAAQCDGLLLSGGGDLHPALYGQQRESDKLSIDPVRDAEEQALFEAFLARNKPVLGICRGIQAVNVFLGGTLRQHIDGHERGCHAVTCEGRLASLVGAAPTVNSYHHQAVDRLPPVLLPAAAAADGTTEALWHVSRPVLAVQWHPERMVPPLCSDVDGANHLALFDWLVHMA